MNDTMQATTQPCGQQVVFSVCPLCKNDCLQYDGICAGSQSVSSIAEMNDQIKRLSEDILRFLGFASDHPTSLMEGKIRLEPQNKNSYKMPMDRKSKGIRLHPYNAKGMQTFGYVRNSKPTAIPLPIKKRAVTDDVSHTKKESGIFRFDVKTFVREVTDRYQLDVAEFDERDVSVSLKPLFFRTLD